MLATIALTILVIGILMGAMAIGVMIQKKSLRGSCGGPDVVDCDGESLACGTCPNRAEKEARKAKQNELLRGMTERSL